LETKETFPEPQDGMMNKIWIVLMIMLTPGLAFGMAEQPKGSPGTSPYNSGGKGGVETCFGSGDVGFESNCIREAASADRQVSYCTMIRIPQMIQQCINEVGAVTQIRRADCAQLGEYASYCEQISNSRGNKRLG
jgi:hypothetical protein